MRRTASGMTFVEVLVAIVIAAIVSIGFYGSAIYTMRQTARNVEHIYALQIVNSAAAKVRTARYSRLVADPADLATGDFEKQFFSPHTIQSNPDGPSTTYTLTYKLKGYGKGVSKASGGGSTKNFNLTQGKSSADWAKDEYASHFLVITGGKGANQVMAIKSNNKTKVDKKTGEKTVRVHLEKKLDGSESGETWTIEPGSSSAFAVDYGLYCEINVSWGSGEGHKTITETVYVPAD